MMHLPHTWGFKMGFFSWKTADTGESIRNRWTDDGATPVKMLLPDGTVYTEENYDGYGEFAGHDFYDLVDLLNGGDGTDRRRGIDLMDVNRHDKPPKGIKAPKLVTLECDKPYADLPDNETCPDQGFFNWN